MEKLAFEELLGCLNLATKEAVKVTRQIEEDKKKAIKSIDDLLAMVEGIPTHDPEW